MISKKYIIFTLTLLITMNSLAHNNANDTVRALFTPQAGANYELFEVLKSNHNDPYRWLSQQEFYKNNDISFMQELVKSRIPHLKKALTRRLIAYNFFDILMMVPKVAGTLLYAPFSAMHDDDHLNVPIYKWATLSTTLGALLAYSSIKNLETPPRNDNEQLAQIIQGVTAYILLIPSSLLLDHYLDDLNKLTLHSPQTKKVQKKLKLLQQMESCLKIKTSSFLKAIV